jgi:hypothetical protein
MHPAAAVAEAEMAAEVQICWPGISDYTAPMRSCHSPVLAVMENTGGAMLARLLPFQQSKSAEPFLLDGFFLMGSSTHKRQLAAVSARLPAGR